MADAKTQHFVPQFMLRRFAEPGSSRSVAVLHLESRRVIRRASIRKQAARDYLYGKDGVLEKTFQPLEAHVAELLRQIENSDVCPQPGTQDHGTLMFFIALQWARSPAAGAEVDAVNDHIVKAILCEHQKHGKYLDLDLNSFSVRKANPVTDALSFLGDTYRHLLDLRGVVVRNSSECEFVLSDIGVTFHNQWRQDDETQAYVGLSAAGLQIYFPIGPRAMLMLYDPEVYAVKSRPGQAVAIDRNQDARQCNSLAIADASKNVYFTGDIRTERQITGTFPRQAPRHAASSSAVVAETEDRQIVLTYRRPLGVKINLPFVRFQPTRRDPPRHPNPILRGWSRFLIAQERSR